MLCGLGNSCNYCETIEFVMLSLLRANFNPHFLRIYCTYNLDVTTVHWPCAGDSTEKIWAFFELLSIFAMQTGKIGPKSLAEKRKIAFIFISLQNVALKQLVQCLLDI